QRKNMLQVIASILCPYTTLFRSQLDNVGSKPTRLERPNGNKASRLLIRCIWVGQRALSSKMALQPLSVNETPKCNRNKSCEHISDRKSTRLNSSHVSTSYAVCCL